jgi:redox-sensitive bicupin YhaK (pirin superfamily)
MAATIVFNNDTKARTAINGAIKEKRIIGLAHEKAPLQPYSNILNWTLIKSDFGGYLHDHPHLGFEILSIVLKGSIEISDKSSGTPILLNEGDISMLQAGKGHIHSEKFMPDTEVLQIWFDADFSEFKKVEPKHHYLTFEQLPISEGQDTIRRKLVGSKGPVRSFTDGLNMEITDFMAGFHTCKCKPDCVLTGFVLEGFVEINEKLIGQHDLFKIEKRKELKLTSLVNSKILLVETPLHPEYATYANLKAF